ncbi:retrotransposon hot spot (RHS) protein [Trypanosoma cruzi]|nr:retrotransposon hot spot (RHS) protein [Trypanosoma cruzi]
MERVWQIVRNDLTELLSTHAEADFKHYPCLLVGTPGIGKSMAAGSYLLYQLLHCDAKKLHLFVYIFGGSTKYESDKITKTVTRYEGEITFSKIWKGLARRGVKGYIIYDVAVKGFLIRLSEDWT